MTLNDIDADRQEWRNLTTASMAEISRTMNTRPDILVLIRCVKCTPMQL